MVIKVFDVRARIVLSISASIVWSISAKSAKYYCARALQGVSAIIM
jgi:hypothetical protein